MKAFILAAGKGERLKPLTNDCPKPLILIKGKPLLEWNLIKLRSAGIKEVVINLHYLGEEIIKYFGNGESFDMKIVYSEESELLGTGGALIHAKKYLNNSPFLLMSGDLWTNYPLQRLISHRTEGKAHLVLVREKLNNRGDFDLLDSKISIELCKKEYTYSGIALINPEIIPQETASNKELWKDLLLPYAKRKLLSGEVFQGVVKNINEKSDIEELDVLIAE